VGGPGNSLDRNYNYFIEKDINYIAERTNNTSVGFVNLFQSTTSRGGMGRLGA
jgi:hypothetical protein